MDAPKQSDPFLQTIIESPSWDDCHQFVGGHHIGISNVGDTMEHEATPQNISAVIKVFKPQANIDFQLFGDGNFIVHIQADGPAISLFHIPEITAHSIRFVADQKLFIGAFCKQPYASLQQLFFCSPFELGFNGSNVKLPVAVSVGFQHIDCSSRNGWIPPDNTCSVCCGCTETEILPTPIPCSRIGESGGLQLEPLVKTILVCSRKMIASHRKQVVGCHPKIILSPFIIHVLGKANIG